MSYFFEFNTIKEGWPELIKVLMLKGELIFDETRESKEERYTKNLHNVMTTFREPNFEQIPKGFPYNKTYLREYSEQFLNPINEKGFEYTYGSRLRSWPFLGQDKNSVIDQIDYIIKDLKNNKQSRRAVATTLFPLMDDFVIDIPCLNIIDFKVNREFLDLTAYFRSNDIMALPSNLKGLSDLLNFVAKETSLRSGTVTIIDGSLHTYERDWKYLSKLINFAYGQLTYQKSLYEKEAKP